MVSSKRIMRALVTAGALGSIGVAGASAQTCQFRVLDATPAGALGNGNSLSIELSGDGRWVAFESSSTNLVPGDVNGARDVFVHDLWTGSTELASVASDGSQANGVSIVQDISADGRYVLFISWASNLHPLDNDGWGDVYVRDRLLGITEWISVPLSPPGTGFYNAYEVASISDDGLRVAFSSIDPDLVPDDTNGYWDVFVRDRALQTTLRVSKSSSGEQGDWASFFPVMSAEGQRVAFYSGATNFHPGGAGNPFHSIHLYYHDLPSAITTAVDVDASGRLAEGGITGWFDMSPDGSTLVLDGSYTLTPLTPAAGHLIWREITKQFETILFANGTTANESIGFPSLSWDGRLVAFHALAQWWKANPFNSGQDVYIHDTASEVTNLVSTQGPAQPALWQSSRPSLSYDGSVVAFLSDDPSLTGAPDNSKKYAMVRICDLSAGVVYCFPTRSPSGCLPVISASGAPSASAGAGHAIDVQGARNGEVGLFLYGTSGGTAVPIGNGWLCVTAPATRLPLQSTGGSPPPLVDCSGSLSVDFNGWVAGGTDPALVPGVAVYVQSWSRDPDHPGGALLSDAVAFVLAP
jgi:Tol biopolymer transport system component